MFQLIMQSLNHAISYLWSWGGHTYVPWQHESISRNQVHAGRRQACAWFEYYIKILKELIVKLLL